MNGYDIEGVIVGVIAHEEYTRLVINGLGESCRKEWCIRVLPFREDSGNLAWFKPGDHICKQSGMVYWTPMGIQRSGQKLLPGGKIYRYNIPVKVMYKGGNK